MKYNDYLEALTKEFVGTWDASEDHGESDLVAALEEAEEKGEDKLARRIFEGAIRYIAEELMCGCSKEEVRRIVEKYERNYPSDSYSHFLNDK